MKFPWEILGYPLYDKIWKDLSFNKDQVKIITTSLHGKRKILELGCGVGNTTHALHGLGKEVYSFDYNKEAVEYVRRKIGRMHLGRVQIIRWDINRLSDFIKGKGFEGHFDGACSASNMGYFDIVPVVKTVYDALSEGGVFAITGFESQLMDRFEKSQGNEVVQLVDSGHIQFSEKDMKRIEELIQKRARGQMNMQYNRDSLRRTEEALLQVGFHVMSQGHFHHDLCYYIIVRK